MINRDSLKDTKIGKIPIEWEINRLGKFMDFKNGLNFNSQEKGQTGTLTIDVKNMYTEGLGIDLSNLYNVNKKINESYLLKKGDILFVRSSLKQEGVGFPNLINIDLKEPLTFCGFIIRGRLNSLTEIDPLYLAYYLRYSKTRKRLISYSGQVAITNISQNALKNLPITIPKLLEQHKIALILSNLDALIIQANNFIETLTTLKKGLMQHLFTEGIGHTEFKETKLGKIPRSWNVLQLKKIGRISTGKTPSTKIDDYWEDEVPFITPGDISDNHYIRKTERFVSYLGAKQSKTVPKDGICTVCIGSTIGKVALVVEDSITNQQINSIICDENIDPHYICYAISKRSKYLKSFAGVAAVPIVKKSLFELFRIPVPSSIEEQKMISKILLSIDDKIEIEEILKNKLKEIKKGLMQNLLTGKKRVKIN